MSKVFAACSIFLLSPILALGQQDASNSNIGCPDRLLPISERIAINGARDLGPGPKGFVTIDLAPEFSEQESNEILSRLIELDSAGHFDTMNREEVAWLRNAIGDAFVDKLLRHLETIRSELSKIFKNEIGHDFTSSWGIRWTDGKQNLMLWHSWHYDNGWFVSTTTLAGKKGTNYTLDDRILTRPWRHGSSPAETIQIDETHFAPINASLIYTALQRTQDGEKKGSVLPPLFHKGVDDHEPRLLIVQILK